MPKISSMYRSCHCLTFVSICSAFGRCLLKEEGVSPDESFDRLSNPRESFLCTKGLCWYEFGNPIVDYSDKRTPEFFLFLDGWSFMSSSHCSLAGALKPVQTALR